MGAPPATALDTDAATSKKRVLAWGMWDWGTQPFNTVITTFVFAVYITKLELRLDQCDLDGALDLHVDRGPAGRGARAGPGADQ